MRHERRRSPRIGGSSPRRAAECVRPSAQVAGRTDAPDVDTWLARALLLGTRSHPPMDDPRTPTTLTLLLDAAAVGPSTTDPTPEPPTPQPTADRGRGFVGSVIAERHPVLLGRVLVRYDRDDVPREAWLPVMRGITARFGDTVLLVDPANWCEPLVVGIIDGFAEETTRPPVVAHRLELRDDEVVEVCDSWGRPLLHVRDGADGPVLSLARADVDLEIAGRLRIRADSLELAALRGAVAIDASDDVVIRGEIIHLN